MIATIESVSDNFNKFNSLIFNGELPPIPIKLVKAKSFLGKIEFKTKRMLGKTVRCDNFLLKISVSFDLPEIVLEDVIIHEMIHYYIAVNKIKDSRPHGEKFRLLMNGINAKYGRNISVRHKGLQAINQSVVRKEYVLCVSTMADGHKGITVCAKTRISEIYRNFRRSGIVSSMQWYVSDDPYFSRFPQSRSSRIYKISQTDLREHLKNAYEITNNK